MCSRFEWCELYKVIHAPECELNAEKVPSTANPWLRWRTLLYGPMINVLSYSSTN